MRPRDLAFAVLVAAIWRFGFVPSKLATNELPPLFVITLRFVLVAGVTIWFVPIPRGAFRAMVGFALTMGIGHFALAYLGLKLGVDSTTAALIWQMQVPLTMLFAYFALGERMGPRGLVGLIVALAGVALFFGEPKHQENLLGLVLQLGGVLCNAIANVQAKRLARLDPITISAWMALLSAPVMGGLSALFESGQFAALAAASWRAPASIAFLGLVSTVVGFSGFYYLLKRYPVGRLSSIVLLVPLFGALFGMTLMNDSVSWLSGLGGGAMLVGVALILYRARVPRVPAEREPLS
jgi:O-acetylserine/cysteine efflux transporter